MKRKIWLANVNDSEHLYELMSSLPNAVLESEQIRVQQRFADLSEKHEIIVKILAERAINGADNSEL